MGLLKLAAVSAAGYTLYKYATRRAAPHAAFASGEVSTGSSRDVRNAGADAMRDKPEQWTKVDEESDASFPASDPPANY